MSRRRLIWHIGLADAARPVVAANLRGHGSALEAAGVAVVASPAEARSATCELMRTHRQAGLRRREVEGGWARICDRIWEHKGVSLLSTPDLCLADKDQIRLALDPLIGVEVHLVVTLESFSQQLYGGWLAELRAGRTTGWEKYVARVLAPAPEHPQAEQFRAGHDLATILERWGWTFRADRLHVLAHREVEQHWLGFLDVAGLPSEGLDPVVPAYADPAGVAVLRRVNRQLGERLTHGAEGVLLAARDDSASMPTVATGSLLPMAASWTGTLAGHDLRGDLTALVDAGAASALPRPRDQLGVAVDALTDSLAENSRLRAEVAGLEADRERLERKRRKLKRRLRRAGVTGSRQS